MAKAQIINHGCCGKTFAACMEPLCYTDKEWLKNLRTYVLGGAIVEMVESKDFKFEKCECPKKVEDPNQLSLF